MGRGSIRENKTDYQLCREELGLSREKAAELLESVSADRIEKIESGKALPYPEEVLTMAEKYRAPGLCNYYCSNQCPIGREYVPEIRTRDLAQIVLEMLASLNSMSKKKDRLIEITADGQIDREELKDFIFIQKELERISVTVDSLRLWSEQMLADGRIDPEAYRAERNK